jgi:hypothetical protein
MNQSAMKRACLVVQHSFGCKNAEFDAYFKIGEKVMKNCIRKKLEIQELFDFAHNSKRWKATTKPTLFCMNFLNFFRAAASNSAFFYTVLIC